MKSSGFYFHSTNGLTVFDKTLTAALNEGYLMHGTRETSPMEVARSHKGFDPAGAGTAYYSSGCYFAERSTYSHHYAFRSRDAEGLHHDPKGPFRHIILAQVVRALHCSTLLTQIVASFYHGPARPLPHSPSPLPP